MHHVYIHIILGILYIMDYILYTTYHILSVSSMLHLPLYISLCLNKTPICVYMHRSTLVHFFFVCKDFSKYFLPMMKQSNQILRDRVRLCRGQPPQKQEQACVRPLLKSGLERLAKCDGPLEAHHV